jgi:predicted esterase
MTRNIYIAVLLLLVAHISAGQGSHEKRFQRVVCDADTNQQYALSLPFTYSAEKSYPLLIFLDPGARGDFPVSKYHSVAAKYGVIMAGSYNSRNFDGPSSVQSFVAIYNDIVKKYSIDPAAVWISGFSGGSRAAAAIAMAYPVITGVIGCGAGFAEMEDQSLKKLKAYAALTGDRDMNFGELVDNHEQLDRLGVNNILLSFEGGHEWPPEPYIEYAFLWLMGRAAITGGTVLERIRAKAGSGMVYTSWFELKQLEKIPAWKDSAALLAGTIRAQRNFTADQAFFETVMEEERKLINEFSLAFTQLLSGEHIEKEQWLSKAERIARLQKNKDRYRQLSGHRCYNQSVATCQEYFFQLMSIRNYAKAVDVANVLLCFDPQHFNGYLMLARAEAGLGNKKRSEKQLREAIKKGLKLSRRVEEDQLLLSLFSAAEIKQLFETK